LNSGGSSDGACWISSRPASLIQQPLAAAILVVALTLQQAAFLQAVEHAGQGRRGQADPPAEGAGGQARLAGQHLQDQQLHGRQPAETGQALGVHLARLLQPSQGLEQGHFEGQHG
jgi:hypothetical protein